MPVLGCEMQYEFYVDLDGVLIDLESSLKQIVPVPPGAWYRHEFLCHALFTLICQKLPSTTHLETDQDSPLRKEQGKVIYDWYTSQVMTPHGEQLWNFLHRTGCRVNILTTRPPAIIPMATKGKHDWATQLDPQPANIIIAPHHQKQLYLPKDRQARRYAVLIDDQDDNLESWAQDGGIAIRHETGDAGPTIEQVRRLLRKTVTESDDEYAGLSDVDEFGPSCLDVIQNLITVLGKPISWGEDRYFQWRIPRSLERVSKFDWNGRVGYDLVRAAVRGLADTEERYATDDSEGYAVDGFRWWGDGFSVDYDPAARYAVIAIHDDDIQINPQDLT